MTVICPKPPVWAQVWQHLKEAAMERGFGQDPPTPLILGGWWASNDLEKQLRWEATLAWARERGLEDKVHVADEDMYETPAYYAGPIGPLGGPMHLEWRFEPVERPKPELLRDRLASLREAWVSLKPGVVTAATEPIRFTGKKARRLEVEVLDTSLSPPWGTWTRLARAPARRSFTTFRKGINRMLHPHAVDHVGFVVKPRRPGGS